MSYRTAMQQKVATELWQIAAFHMYAGLEINTESRTVHRTAPIVNYMTGWPLWRVREYCAKKKWNLRQIGGETGA